MEKTCETSRNQILIYNSKGAVIKKYRKLSEMDLKVFEKGIYLAIIQKKDGSKERELFAIQ